MKCSLIITIVIVSCVVPKNTLARGSQSSNKLTITNRAPSPAMVTAASCVLGKNYGIVGTMVFVEAIRAANFGVKKFEETKDIILAAKVAGEYGIASVSTFLKCAAGVAANGGNLIRKVVMDINDGKDARDALHQRTKEVVSYLKEEVVKNPNGEVANALITNGNIVATCSMGPLVGWSSATLALAASEAAAKFKETNNPFQASLVAAESGHRSASELMDIICSLNGLVTSGVGFAIDISWGKDPHSSFMKRGNQALESLKIVKKQDKK